jgi:hypothetical protein
MESLLRNGGLVFALIDTDSGFVNVLSFAGVTEQLL